MRRVLVVDVETTGMDPKRHEVVELAIHEFGSGEAWRWRFRPTRPVDPQAMEVHGIPMGELAECSTFGSYFSQPSKGIEMVLPSFADDLLSADVIVGYNMDFDLRMLDAELSRVGVTWDRQHVTLIDAYKLWVVSERRKLADAVRRFLGREPAAMHSALVDVGATAEVLVGMVDTFALPVWDVDDQKRRHEINWEALADHINPNRRLYLGSAHFMWDAAGEVTFAQGKNKGREVYQADRSYLAWMKSKDFPAAAVEVAHQVLTLQPEAFYAWARAKYPPPIPVAAGVAP